MPASSKSPGEWAPALLLPLLLLVAAPALVVVDQVVRARVRRPRGDTSWTRTLDVRFENDTLVLVDACGVERLPLDELSELSAWHVTGDAGFADANSLHYLVKVVREDGTARYLEFSEAYPHPFVRVVLEPLRAKGGSKELRIVRGPVQGLGGCVLYGAALLWCLVVAAGALRLG